MSIEHWLAFAAASAVLLAIPGPTILVVVSHALAHGRRTAAASVAGVALGDFTAMTASMLGLGAILATSAALFTVLKWLGAAYLVYLGVKLFLAPVPGLATGEPSAPATRPRRVFAHTYAVTALNPKSIVFFVAFLPQFLDPAGPVLPQIMIFQATFLTLATLNAALYVALATKAADRLRAPAVRRRVNRVGGSALVAAGLGAALWRRAPA